MSANLSLEENFRPCTTSNFQMSVSGFATISMASFNNLTGMFMNVPDFFAFRLLISVFISAILISVNSNLVVMAIFFFISVILG